ncbi:MAG: DUF748 domain-containing protein [Candidatus Omnitrophica bacterium]|nr:DUF748 domain-containing protein [Candidatus Omnitrophota bacterium]
MRKKIFIILAIPFVLISAGIIYLNYVVLPVRIKAAIIKGIAEATQKKVNLESVRFNIFKGLVLRNLSISDDKVTLLSLKEASCVILIPPIFKKQIIIPFINIKSPLIYLERKSDNSLNLAELFLNRPIAPLKSNFNFFIYRISLSNGRINFQDDTVKPAFTKEIDNLDLVLRLSLPNKIRFNLKAQIPAGPPILINSAGEYNLSAQELKAKVLLKDLSLQDFLAYYKGAGVSVSDGRIDLLAGLLFKEGVLNLNLQAQSKGLIFSKDKISLKALPDLRAKIQYNPQSEELTYSGNLNILNAQVWGIEPVGRIDEIKAMAQFDNAGFTCDNLSANILGVPVEAKISLANVPAPLLKINLNSSLNLNLLAQILKDKFKLGLPAEVQGEGRLLLSLESGFPVTTQKLEGTLDISGGSLKLEKINSPLGNINGRIKFNQQQIAWPELNFKYLGIDYKTSGTLTNFKLPQVEMQLSSKDLLLKSDFSVNGKLLNFRKASGKYFNSEFQVFGDLDFSDPQALNTKLNLALDIDLANLKDFLPKFKDQIQRSKPAGAVHLDGSLQGNINDWKNCSAKFILTSNTLSLYGLKTQEFLLNFNQENKIADITQMRLGLYDGTLDAVGKMNLDSSNLPYWLAANIQGVKIEKLKLDTPSKGKDIAGTIQAEVKLNGFSGDMAKLSGAGKITVTDGRLWELNLFRGLGALIFTSDFNNIVFSEGSCSFVVKDKYIFTEDLKLKSNLSDIVGTVKIGFDGAIDASLNVQVTEEAPLTGTIKDVTTAIMGQAGRFGVIRITGTVPEPKYSFKPAVVDIIKGIKDAIFQKN